VGVDVVGDDLDRTIERAPLPEIDAVFDRGDLTVGTQGARTMSPSSIAAKQRCILRLSAPLTINNPQAA
jgi:hypothetical protein